MGSEIDPSSRVLELTYCATSKSHSCEEFVVGFLVVVACYFRLIRLRVSQLAKSIRGPPPLHSHMNVQNFFYELLLIDG